MVCDQEFPESQSWEIDVAIGPLSKSINNSVLLTFWMLADPAPVPPSLLSPECVSHMTGLMEKDNFPTKYHYSFVFQWASSFLVTQP